MKTFKSYFYIILLGMSLFLVAKESKAQTINTPPRIAILAPLYLDSAFDNNNYKLGNTVIPKYILPGLDFYNGVMMAVDSLQKEGNDLDVWVFDIKKKNLSVDSLAAELATHHFSLIIASFSNANEQKVFSQFSFNNNIPLVSATYPNDAYVTGNPFFIMLNSTLKTHVEGIYKFIQRNYPVAKFLYVTRQGSMEEKIMTMYADAGKKTYPIKYKTVALPDDFTAEQLLPLLDSNAQNVIICGSLDENFGSNLIKVLDQNITFPISIAGSPTWDGLRATMHTENENVSIIYSTPFNYAKSDFITANLTNQYRQQLNGRPSDMFFKGYESMYRFSKLLLKYNNDMLNNLSDNNFKISNTFLLQPVKLNITDQLPAYIENKKLYFITRNLGKIVSVN
ncbi:hypothetical protein BH11BAC6_BH11BAC6_04390 [soil metagenome]